MDGCGREDDLFVDCALYTLRTGREGKKRRGCGLGRSHNIMAGADARAVLPGDGPNGIALCCEAIQVGTGRTRIIVHIVITTIVVSSSQAWSKSTVNHILFVFRSSPNPSLASESALCPPNPSPSSITTWTQRLINSSVAPSIPPYRSLRPSVATIILFVTDLSSFRCWTSGTADT